MHALAKKGANRRTARFRVERAAFWRQVMPQCGAEAGNIRPVVGRPTRVTTEQQ